MFIVSELQNYISYTKHCLYFCYKVIFSFLSQDQINMSASTDFYKKIALKCFLTADSNGPVCVYLTIRGPGYHL